MIDRAERNDVEVHHLRRRPRIRAGELRGHVASLAVHQHQRVRGPTPRSEAERTPCPFTAFWP